MPSSVPSTSQRIHVGPLLWGQVGATDFWIGASDSVTLGASTAVNALASAGWTATSVVFTNTATGDFGSSADDTPSNFGANAGTDVLTSPVIFGNYAHMLGASRTLGYQPTTLNADVYGAFTTASANEAATYIGFTPARVYSGGTASTFFLSNSSATAAGAAIDTAYHLWRFTVDATNTTLAMDGAAAISVATLADVWPAAFGWVVSTTNRPAMSWAHIWYA